MWGQEKWESIQMHRCRSVDSASGNYCHMGIQAREDSNRKFYLKSYNF